MTTTYNGHVESLDYEIIFTILYQGRVQPQISQKERMLHALLPWSHRKALTHWPALF